MALRLVPWLLLLASSSASAAGFFLAPRGVRPLSRGGAFVAGADDVNALSYNPAGLAETRQSVLFDLGIPIHRSRYVRRVEPDSADLDEVTGRELGLASPTLGAVLEVPGFDTVKIGLGLAADYPALQNWPDGTSAEPAPQRYAIGNYTGTVISKASLGGAVRLGQYVSAGGAFQLLMGRFTSEVTISACDGLSCTHPEDPAYDARVQIATDMIVAPGAHLGVLLKLPYVRLGLSWETGYTLEQDADLRIRLPDAAMYANATLDPATPRAEVSLRLPQSVRAGAEFRWEELLRTELAVVWDNWAVHDRIQIDPNDAVMRDVFGLGDYSLAPMSIERRFRDVWSVRLGGEVTPPWRGERPYALRFGVMVEPSAVPDEALTAMTVDMDKLIAAGGVSLRFGRVEVQASYAYVFMRDRQVGSSEILQTNPTRPAWNGVTAIGNGDYEGSAHVVGLGASLLL